MKPLGSNRQLLWCIVSLCTVALVSPIWAADDLLLGSHETDNILRYDGSTGAFVGEFVPAGSGGLYSPAGGVFGPDGNLYVSSTSSGPNYSGNILRYQGASGAFIDEFVPVDSGALNGPAGLAFGPDGHLYVTSFFGGSGGTGEILRYNGNTGAFINTFVPAGSGGLNGPYDVTFGPDGNLYVASFFTDSVLRYNGTTGAFISEFVASGSGGLDETYMIRFRPDGFLYVTNNGGSVLRYDALTGGFGDVFIPAGTGGLQLPGGMAWDASGNFYVTSDQVISPTEAVTGVLRFNGVTGAFIDEFVPHGSGGGNYGSFILFVPEPHLAGVVIIIAFVCAARRNRSERAPSN